MHASPPLHVAAGIFKCSDTTEPAGFERIIAQLGYECQNNLGGGKRRSNFGFILGPANSIRKLLDIVSNPTTRLSRVDVLRMLPTFSIVGGRVKEQKGRSNRRGALATASSSCRLTSCVVCVSMQGRPDSAVIPSLRRRLAQTQPMVDRPTSHVSFFRLPQHAHAPPRIPLPPITSGKQAGGRKRT